MTTPAGLPGEGVGREAAARLTALLPDPVHMTRQHVIDRVFAALELDPDEAAVSSWARALVLHVELVHGCEHTGQLRSVLAALSSPETTPAGGTTTDCPLEGVHEHAFRGPHRFHEWEPGT